MAHTAPLTHQSLPRYLTLVAEGPRDLHFLESKHQESAIPRERNYPADDGRIDVFFLIKDLFFQEFDLHPASPGVTDSQPIEESVPKLHRIRSLPGLELTKERSDLLSEILLVGVEAELGSPALPPEELDLLADVGGEAEVVNGEDFEQRGQLLGEVVEVARDLGAPNQEPEPARLGAVLQEELGSVDKDVQLPEAQHRRGGKPQREGGGGRGGEGFLKGIEEDGEDPEHAGEGPGVTALGPGRPAGDIGGERGEGVEEGGDGQVPGREERSGEGRPPAPDVQERERGRHRSDILTIRGAEGS